MSTIPWTRSLDRAKNPKIDDRTVNHEEIEKLLEDRQVAKKGKDFKVADEIADNLQARGICYHDETKVWYTRVIIEEDVKKKEGRQRKTKRQLRNRRQAEKNRKKAKGTTDKDGDSDGNDDSGEDEDED